MKFFEEIEIGKQSRNKTQQQRIDKHYGFDTETLNGKLHLITYANDNGEMGYLYIDVNKPNKGILDILGFLTQKKFRGNLKWFYNLDYDIRAVMRWMNEENIQELYDTHNTTIGDYEISFLSHKFFSIIKGKNKYIYFDIAQFFRGGLDKNAKFYLGDKKIDTIDVIRLGEDAGYWIDNLPDVIKYCIYDSLLTGKLGGLLYTNLWRVLKFNPKYPYSAGSISQEYFINYSVFIPKVAGIPNKILEIHQNNYRGGRIEIMKRGFFENIYSFDIKSAYPAEMANLLDYSNGVWVETKDFDEKVHGYYRVKFNWYNQDLGFIAFTVDNKTIYPNAEQCISWMNEKELCFLNDNARFCSFEVLEGYKFVPYAEKYPYRDIIQEFYELKESATDINERMLYKLFINSIYGKTAQAIYDKDSKVYKTGRLYNPVYSCRITANTRLKLLEYALPISRDVIGFSTDSIQTLNSNVKTGKKMGDFELEYIAKEGVVLMSGIRYLVTEEETKQKTRGFANTVITVDDAGKRVKEDLILKDILNANLDKDVIEIMIEKPVTVFQGLNFEKYNKDDINVFKSQRRFLDVNGDTRRVWFDDFKNTEDVFSRNIESIPIFIEGVSNR